MKGAAMPHTASTMSCRALVPFKHGPRKAQSVSCGAQHEHQHNFGAILLSTGLAVSIGLLALLPSPAIAEDTYALRREAMEKRKEMLSKTRQKALAGGGQEDSEKPAAPGEVGAGAKPEAEGDTNTGAKAETKMESSTAPAVSPAEQEKIKKATDEVNKANAAREKEAEKMRKGMASSLKQYESKSGKSEQKFKPGKPTKDFESPSFLKSFIEERQKGKSEETPPPAPQPTPTPAPAPSPVKPPPSQPEKPTPPPQPSPLASKTTSPPTSSSSKPTSGQGEGQKAPATESAQGEKLAASPTKNVPKPTPPPELPKPEPGPAVPAPSDLSKPKPKVGIQPLQKQQPSKPDLPKPKVGVQPVQKQEKTVEAKKGKQKGPLPMTLVQLLVLASFGGLGYLTFFREEDVDKALAKTGSVVADLYAKVDKSSGKLAKKAEAEVSESQS